MPFESDSQYPTGSTVSPGGFEFGVQGWSLGQPTPKSITFFTDGSAMVCDQYGRPIRCSVLGDKVVNFADRPPDGSQDGLVTPRPQFATHAQLIAILAAEGLNWLGHQVQWRTSAGALRTKKGLTAEAAAKEQKNLLDSGNSQVIVTREIACAGWPQLKYEELKKLPTSALPPVMMDRNGYTSYLDNLSKIPDPSLRKDALRYYKELYEAGIQEMNTVEVG